MLFCYYYFLINSLFAILGQPLAHLLLSNYRLWRSGDSLLLVNFLLHWEGNRKYAIAIEILTFSLQHWSAVMNISGIPATVLFLT